MLVRRRSGFTLVELLVVIAIIGVLVALLLPAVQSARESSRRTQCSNQLKQMGLAFQNHHNAHKFLPSNGWGYQWVGDPDLGYGRKQPGGWMFNILPYVEADTIRQLGAGKPAMSAQRKAATATRLTTVMPGFICPSRRHAALYDTENWLPHFRTPFYSDPVLKVARSCYAVNGGDVYSDPNPPKGPDFLADANSATWGTEFARLASVCTGISYPESTVKIAQITDGTSKTYMVGEKYVNPDSYYDGTDPGDNETMYMGENGDIIRWTYLGPQVDTPGVVNWEAWGSAHPAVFNMVLCDGSVRGIAYTIDLTLHKRLGNRKDGVVIDTTTF